MSGETRRHVISDRCSAGELAIPTEAIGDKTRGRALTSELVRYCLIRPPLRWKDGGLSIAMRSEFTLFQETTSGEVR